MDTFFRLLNFVPKRGQTGERRLKLNDYLGTPITLTLPVVAPDAWWSVVQMHGEVVPGIDIGDAHWKAILLDDLNRHGRFELQYAHSLGVNPLNIHPRTLTCDVQVRGNGITSDVELTFNAHSAMDYHTVRDIIEKTKASLAHHADHLPEGLRC
jgi:hypothetical protein